MKFYLKNDVKEYVAENEKNDDANWICEYCKAQNDARTDVCSNCGSPKSEAERDYFGNAVNKPVEQYVQHVSVSSTPAQTYVQHVSASSAQTIQTVASSLLKKEILIPAAIILAVSFLLWLFIPITKTSTIQSFEWERTIAIEEFRNISENDWSLPQNARLRYTKQEIHHYDCVIDHYEHRTRQVAHQEFDGYDTSYRDLGNGQFEEVRTPRYKIVYTEESYEKPVYRNNPVYQTKYYYDIDRWIKVSEAWSGRHDHEPYWKDTGLETSVLSPEYGDQREGVRNEKYYAIIMNKKGKTKKIEYSFAEWNSLSVGDEINYKDFRFS